MSGGLPVPATAADDGTLVNLKRKLAEAHLEHAEQGTVKAALTVLLQIGLGKDGAGNPLKAAHRTRVAAMAAYLRNLRETIDGETERPAGDAQITINIGVPALVKKVPSTVVPTPELPAGNGKPANGKPA